MAMQSDHELVQLAREGDKQAFGALVRRYDRRLFRLVFHVLRDATEAQDVVQETFIRAYRGLGGFQSNSQPYTWFYRIAVNLSLNALRARKPRQHLAEDDPRVDAWMADIVDRGPEVINEQRQLAMALCEGIDELSETLRTTLLLVALDGLGHGDVATILGCSEGTVAWRVHEARRKLRMHLHSCGLVDAEVGR